MHAIEKSVIQEQVYKDPRMILLKDRKEYIIEFCDSIFNILNDDEKDPKYADVLSFKNNMRMFFDDVYEGLYKHIQKTFYCALCGEEDVGVRLVNMYIGASHKFGGRILQTLMDYNKDNS